MITPEELAQQFHEAYERLAPQYGYKTREASAVPWDNVPEANKKLMIAVVSEILGTRANLPDDGCDEAVQMLENGWRVRYIRSINVIEWRSPRGISGSGYHNNSLDRPPFAAVMDARSHGEIKP